MRKSTKIWLIAAALLILLGFIMFAVAMTACNWDFTKLSTIKYQTNIYELSKEFNSISIKTDTADIVFETSNDGMCKVVCYEMEHGKHTVNIQDKTLAIHVEDDKEWYEYIGINFGQPQITVYLPQGDYSALSIETSTGDVEVPKDFQFRNMVILGSTGDVNNCASVSEGMKIKTGTGNIHVENISADMLDLSVSTGHITVTDAICNSDVQINVSTGKTNITNLKCKNIISSGNTGDISLRNVIAAGKFSIERSTGDVRFDGCDGVEIFVKTDTGDVIGTLLSDKIFIVQTDTGSIDVPESTTGGKCEISTDTGDIKISVSN